MLNNAEDKEDLLQARAEMREDETPTSWWKYLGPGLITGAADDDPSGIGTYSVTGAQFGYSLLWLVPLCLPLMIAVQEMCGRIGIVTGSGFAAVIKNHYPRWLLYFVVTCLALANIINIYADLNVMAASLQMVLGSSFWLWLTIITVFLVLTPILIPYTHYVKVLKWLCLPLASYVIVALLPSAKNDWHEVFHNLVIPAWSWKPDFIMAVVGVLGTTISPYLFFWQAGEEVEEEIAEGLVDEPGHRLKRVSEDEIRDFRRDTVIGMAASQIVCFFIIVCTAANLHESGVTDINTAQDAAKALLPLGKPAYWLFTFGILGAGLLAIPTMAGSAAYAVAETFDWRYGLYRRYQRAKGFYGVIAGMVLAGYALNFIKSISPLKSLFYASILNGVIAVPLLVLLMIICNNRNIVKERTNSTLSNVLGWSTILLMGGAVILMFWGMATGHNS